jgi:hypothetical protein
MKFLIEQHMKSDYMEITDNDDIIKRHTRFA